MKAVGDDRPFGHRPLQPIDLEQIRGGEHRQPVERVLPERTIVGQTMKRRQQRLRLAPEIS